MKSKYAHITGKTWDAECWIGCSNGEQKLEEEYVPGSSICGMFVKEKVKLITFFDCKIEFG